MNIPYELARELKGAGFPKKMIVACKRLNDNSHSPCRADRDDCLLEVLGSPTLPQLIEACGEEFQGIGRTGMANGDKWEAYDRNLHEHGHGNTPEESVARLWLAFNKKS